MLNAFFIQREKTNTKKQRKLNQNYICALSGFGARQNSVSIKSFHYKENEQFN